MYADVLLLTSCSDLQKMMNIREDEMKWLHMCFNAKEICGASWVVQTRKTNPRWRTAATLKNLKTAIFPQRF